MQQESYELSELDHGSVNQSTGAAADPSRGSSGTAPAAPVRLPSWSLKKFWEDNVNCVVDFEKCRDHLALERTFLAYLRTALMAAIVGTLVAQLFVLESDDDGFGYLAVGRPLATLCFVFSICTVLAGTCRAWRHQRAMINGKALTGGFEIVFLAVISLAMICVFLGILIALDVLKGTG